MEETQNSLYALPSAKVCWVVLKKDKTLVRIEGNAYHLPLLSDERVEIDTIMTGLEIFDVYHEKDKILVLIQQQGKEPISFMLQGITKPEKKKEKKKKKKKPASKTAVEPKTETPKVPESGAPQPTAPEAPKE